MTMTRRELLLPLAATLLAPSISAREAGEEGSGKKGWCGFHPRNHETFGANWYYTWTPDWQSGGAIEFVPMIKTGNDVAKAGRIGAKSKYLLGFNEPERKDQGNLSVDRAIELWPELEKVAKDRGIPLGSPAPSSDKQGLDWLAAFMKKAKSADLQIDFMAVHYYRSRRPDDLEDFIKEIAREYRRPVWLTEFNGWSGPEREHYDFLRKSLRFLERNRDVERYAYFDPGAGKPHSLFTADGEPTRLGKLYQEAGT